MSVVGQIQVESRRYSGWNDPRFPIGYWMAALTVTGDGTGGSLLIDLLFQPAVNPRLNSQLYSLEAFSITTSDGADRVLELRTVNMDGPSNEGFRHSHAVDVDGKTIITGGSGRSEAQAIVPLFLGSQRNAGTSASLSLVAPNVTGVAFHLEGEGYRWSPRSVLVDGGPQRPPTGLYGT